MLRTCFKAEPTTLDPRKNSEVMSSRVQLMLYEGLTRLLPGGEIEWALAESVEISEDGRTYVFHLRDASWSDGKAITAQDFEYSWKKVLTPSFGAPSSILFSPIEGALGAISGERSPEECAIRALDEKTLEVRLTQPTPYFLSLVGFCPFYPVPKHIDQQNPKWSQETDRPLVISGPYSLVSWARNERLEFIKNKAYHDLANVTLDGIEILIVSDEKTAVRMFEKKEVDWIDSTTMPFSLDDMEYLKQEKGLESSPIGGTFFCAFNLDTLPFSNRHIRLALSAAIDRKTLVKHASPIDEQAASRVVPPLLWKGENRELIPDGNRPLAQEYFAKGLKELGIERLEDLPEWKDVCLSYEAGDQNRRIAQIIQREWKDALGLEIPLVEMDYKTQLASIENRHFTLTLDYWLAHFNDPVNILDRFKYKSSKKNYPGFSHPEYVELLTRASETNDTALRTTLLNQAEALFAHEMPLTPLFHQSQAVLKGEKIVSIALNPIGNPNYKTILLRL